MAKDARLTLAALNHAVFHRRPRPGVSSTATVGWSTPPMRPREITDNAPWSRFFHSMKSDTVHGVTFVPEVELAHVTGQL